MFNHGIHDIFRDTADTSDGLEAIVNTWQHTLLTMGGYPH